MYICIYIHILALSSDRPVRVQAASPVCRLLSLAFRCHDVDRLHRLTKGHGLSVGNLRDWPLHERRGVLAEKSTAGQPARSPRLN